MLEHEPQIEIELHLFPRLEKAGHFIKGLFQQMHHEGYSDHHFEHPLDAPVEPVVDWPGQNRWDDEGCYFDRGSE